MKIVEQPEAVSEAQLDKMLTERFMGHPQKEPEEPAEVSDEPEEVEEPELVAESDEQVEVEEPEEAQEYTVADIAEALEMPEDDLLRQLKLSAKIDGKVETLTLDEIRKGYQREADYTRKTQKLAEERKQVEQAITQKAQAIEQAHQQLAGLIQFQEQQLRGSWNDAEMAQLRQTDPAEYAARYQDFQTRYQQVEAAKQYGMQQWAAQQQQLQAEAERLKAKKLEEANAKLSESLPGWNDQSKRQQIVTDLVQYLRGMGMSDEALNDLTDPVFVTAAYKAMLHDKGGSVGKEVKSKMQKLPKMLQPGNKQTRAARKKADISKKLERFRKTHSDKDLHDILVSRM